MELENLYNFVKRSSEVHLTRRVNVYRPVFRRVTIVRLSQSHNNSLNKKEKVFKGKIEKNSRAHVIKISYFIDV